MIRVSGPDAFKALEKLFRPGGKRPFPQAFSAFPGNLVDPGTHQIVDQVVVTTFVGPASFTGEDLAEIGCHGNPVILSQVLSLLFQAGVRAAEPGEFTRRAFLNGKLDLLEVEATAQVLSATSSSQVRVALNQLEGLPTRRLREIRERLIDHLVRMEAVLNFPEDAGEEIPEGPLVRELVSLRGELERFATAGRAGSLLAKGVPVVLLGRPNTGKSSLLNALLGRERAIVTEVPGTTRDTLEELLVLGDVPLQLIDTAGLRDPSDVVEEHGIRRTHLALDRAFLLVGVFDGSVPFTPEDEEVIRLLQVSTRPVVSVLNKADLPQACDADRLGRLARVQVSARTGVGLDRLRDCLLGRLNQEGLTSLEDMVLMGAQQTEALEKGLQAVDRAANGVGTLYLDMLALEVEEAVRQLGRVTGETVDLHTLDRIFERFCIGK